MLVLVLLPRLLLRLVMQLVQDVLDVFPARPFVELAVGELVAHGIGVLVVVVAVAVVQARVAADGGSGKRLRASPDPGIVRVALHVSGNVRKHLLVGFELLPRGAGAQAFDQLVQEEAQVAAAGHVVLAQVADGSGHLKQGQSGGVLAAERQDQDAAPDVGAEEGGTHGPQTSGPAAHVGWGERALGIDCGILSDGDKAIESVTAFGTTASGREVVSV